MSDQLAYALIGVLIGGWMFSGVIARLLSAIVPFLWQHAKESRYKKWQGKHFAFRNVQVRFCLHEDVVWMAEEDIFGLLKPPPDRLELRAIDDKRGIIPGHDVPGVTLAGVERLLALRTNHRRSDPEMLALRRWLLHEAVPHIRKRPESSM